MADAGERKPNFNALTLDNLRAAPKAVVPVKRDERVESREPSTREVQSERGRSPQDVLQTINEEPAEVRTQESEERPARRIKVKGREITLDQLANQPDLLEALVTTAEQFPALQQKHQKLLEEISQKALERKEELKVEKPTEVITQAQIREKYDPVVKQAAADGYMDGDFAEAYPDTAAQLIYHRDIIYALDTALGQCVEWIKCEVQIRNAGKVDSMLNTAIDRVAAKADNKQSKDAYLFKPLKDDNQRAGFITWLKTDVDPKVGALTVENVERFWKAYIADKLLELPNPSTDRRPVQNNPQKAAGDGTGSRTGTPESPKELTKDRQMFKSMLESTGKISLQD